MLNTLNPLLPLQASLWPLLISLNLFSVFTSIIFYWRLKISILTLVLAKIRLILVCLLWWKDIKIESNLGFHTHKLEIRMRAGMLFFILSEVFFFISFFWAFYDAALAPTIELGMMWPPKGIVTLSIYSVPLLNTILLLRSGLSVTWAHHSLLRNFYKKRIIALVLTMLLGAYFIFIQYEEYKEAIFTISDRVYGRTFFIATGFHGFHVVIGTLFLFRSCITLVAGSLTKTHHFSFEFAAWYWHFVDVVWLFLFISVYWWGRLG